MEHNKKILKSYCEEDMSERITFFFQITPLEYLISKHFTIKVQSVAENCSPYRVTYKVLSINSWNTDKTMFSTLF